MSSKLSTSGVPDEHNHFEIRSEASEVNPLPKTSEVSGEQLELRIPVNDERRSEDVLREPRPPCSSHARELPAAERKPRQKMVLSTDCEVVYYTPCDTVTLAYASSSESAFKHGPAEKRKANDSGEEEDEDLNAD